MNFEPHDDDNLDEWVEDEQADDPSAEILMCPGCRAAVHEDTQQCPHCGDWITPVYPGENRRKWIWLVAVVLVICGLLGLGRACV